MEKQEKQKAWNSEEEPSLEELLEAMDEPEEHLVEDYAKRGVIICLVCGRKIRRTENPDAFERARRDLQRSGWTGWLCPNCNLEFHASPYELCEFDRKIANITNPVERLTALIHALGELVCPRCGSFLEAKRLDLKELQGPFWGNERLWFKCPHCQKDSWIHADGKIEPSDQAVKAILKAIGWLDPDR